MQHDAYAVNALQAIHKKRKKTEDDGTIPSEPRTKLCNSASARRACYTEAMQDELEFRRVAESALDALKKHLIAREEEDESGFEVEEQNGVLNVVFEEPPGKFVITPNTPVRQIWISALATSFKLDWDVAASAFILPRTGEQLELLVDRLIDENLQE